MAGRVMQRWGKQLQGVLKVVFFTVFVVSFMSADYLITGSVTNTWIGVAVITGMVVTLIRGLAIRLTFCF